MATSAPKRARVVEEEGVVQGYLHRVSPLRISQNEKQTKYFNCHWQTSRDEWRRCVVYSVEKHGYYQQLAVNHTPLKLYNSSNIRSNVGPDLDIRVDYKAMVKELESLDFGYIEDPTILKSEEEVQVPASVARQRLEAEQQEVEQEEVERNTVRGPVCGVKLADQWHCSSCNEWQQDFNPMATNHRCEACGFLQRVGSYVMFATGTVMVNKGDVKLTLKLTSIVLMTYLSQNDPQGLLSNVQLVEEHFLEVGLFVIQYNANNEVVVVTTGNV